MKYNPKPFIAAYMTPDASAAQPPAAALADSDSFIFFFSATKCSAVKNTMHIAYFNNAAPVKRVSAPAEQSAAAAANSGPADMRLDKNPVITGFTTSNTFTRPMKKANIPIAITETSRFDT
jgi:hypothetical protein